MKKVSFTIDEFMIYCESKNLSKKTMMSYEKTLRLFSKYLEEDIRKTYQAFNPLANMRGGR